MRKEYTIWMDEEGPKSKIEVFLRKAPNGFYKESTVEQLLSDLQKFQNVLIARQKG